MIREEEIKQAAKANASQMCNLCLDKYCMEMELTCPNLHESVITFTDGVEWADQHPNLESLWHKASEEPQGEYEIIYQDEFNHVWLATYRKDIEQYKNWWEECVACNYIVRWAYISDLLPKGSTKRIER